MVELLVVMALIAILSGFVLTSISGRDEAQSLDAAVTKATSFFDLARSAAISRHTSTRVLFHYNPAEPERYLRYGIVVFEDPDAGAATERWKVLAEGEFLPLGVYLSPQHIASSNAASPQSVTWTLHWDTLLGQSAMSAPSAASPGPQSWIVFEFLANGNAARPMSRAVFANGIVNGSDLNVPNPNNVAGFAVFRSGQTLGFQDIRQIQEGL